MPAVCGTCGTANDAQARLCTGCGATLAADRAISYARSAGGGSVRAALTAGYGRAFGIGAVISGLAALSAAILIPGRVRPGPAEPAAVPQEVRVSEP